MSYPRLRCYFFLFISLIPLLCLVFVPGFRHLTYLPYNVRLIQGEVRELATGLPIRLYVRTDDRGALRINGRPVDNRWLPLEQGALSLQSVRAGKYDIELRLLGLIPVRRVTVDVIPPMSVVPAGHSVGVLVQPEGVLVVGDSGVKTAKGLMFPARDAGLKEGDVILSINGKAVHNKEEAGIIIAEAGRKREALSLVIRRGSETLECQITPVYDEEKQRYLIGLWIRDGVSGVGTLTFYEEDTGRYGALGHLVTDPSGVAVQPADGRIVQALISGIRPGRPGSPGEKLGVFVNLDSPLGVIDKNTIFGIFGRLDPARLGNRGELIPVSPEWRVKEGPAEIITVLRGQQPERFSVEIEKVYHQDRPDDRGMVIRITDPRLLAVTGGIVQGMSGSPVIQEGQLVGAVTHVFVNDPTRGYGIFAEWMIRQMVSPARAPIAANPVWPGRSATKVREFLEQVMAKLAIESY